MLMFEGFGTGVPGAQRFDNNRGANGESAMIYVEYLV